MTNYLDQAGAEEIIRQLKAELDVVLKRKVLALYPVGTILFSPDESYDPNECIGGTWTRSDAWVDDTGSKLIPDGGYYPRMMSAANDKYVGDRVNANQWHYLKASHLPPHTHTAQDVPMLVTEGTPPQANSGSASGFKNSGTLAYTSTSAGGDLYASSPYTIEPPYYAVYAWQREA